MIGSLGVIETAILIFLARILDVSLGTIRIILLSKGHRLEASLIGFFESFLWLVVTAQIISHMENPLYYVAFAGGFACGNYVGLVLEGRLALGSVIVRVITRQDPHLLVDALRGEGFAITTVDARGKDGPVVIIFAVLERKKIKKFLKLVNQLSPQAFYTIEDVREVKVGMPVPANGGVRKVEFLKRLFWPKRK
ncbi:MAG: DUF2179 domain-containing protein [Synergistetes bacterium]|nr:MAG: hypothetical protein XD52_0127 [bacterium 42_11]MBC7331598.1 DUF2179 domain-containing protein [Synergistota bacterium]MDK2871234.1 hypothetical protein [bacterium]